MNRYAKLWHKSGESPDIGEALETNPLAVSLFCLSLPRADLYGILPGEARRYRAAVAPAAILTADVVEDAIQEQERRGWVVRYADSTGETLLYIRHYHLYQEVRWRNGVGPPEHELPECWEPTRDFLRWITDQRCIDSRKHGAEWQSLRERYGSATVVDAPEAGLLRESRRTADSRQQTVDTERRNTIRQHLPTPAVAAVGPDEPSGSDDPTQAKSKRTRKPAVTPDGEPAPETPAQRLAASAWTLFGLDGTPPPKVYSAATQLYAAHGDKCADLLDYLRAEEDLDLHGADPAVKVPAVLRSWIAEGKRFLWDETSPKFNGGKPKQRFTLRPGGVRVPESEWGIYDAPEIDKLVTDGTFNVKTGCTRQPMKGFCCDDGLYYGYETWPVGVPI